MAPLLIAASLVACATPAGGPGSLADVHPAERPARGSDEAALWMHAERHEEVLRTSPAVIRDARLHDYVHGIVCRLAGPHCLDLRVYVMRRAQFKATVAPNGTIQIWTGVLLRTSNEAQLAYVLGHEIAHYLRRHMLQRWGEFHARATDLARELAGLAAFSREQEHEADQLGFDLMLKAGYDGREAPRVWERLTAELGGGEKPASVFLAMHPPTTERLARLRGYAEDAGVMPGAVVGREEFLARLRPIRRRLLDDEVRRRDIQDSERLLRRLVEEGDGLGELHFALGEMRRLRATGPDLGEAIAAYQRALQFSDAPPETLRSLGLVYARLRDLGRAADTLARYLERRPEAEDRELIESQIAELRAAP